MTPVNPALLDDPIQELEQFGVETRDFNAMEKEGIRTIRDLLNRTTGELRNLPQWGPGRVHTLVEAVKQYIEW